MTCNLFDIRRQLDFPLKVKSVAMREQNTWIHQGNRLQDIFLSFVFAIENERMETEVNGEKIVMRAHECPKMIVAYPGMVLTTLVPSRQRELFFVYRPEDRVLFDSFRFKKCSFKRTKSFDTALSRLENALDRFREPGMTDRIDLLAIELGNEAMLSSQNLAMGVGGDIPDERIFSVAKELDFNYNHPVELKILVERQNMTVRTFLRQWYKYYSVSPMHYLINLRLEHAKRLLGETNYKIYEIADKCGFCDVMYFSRYFKKNIGITPKNYRESCWGGTVHR